MMERNLLTDFQFYKVFNAPRDIDELRKHINNLFRVVFMSVFDKRTKQHYIVPMVTEVDEDKRISVQKITESNMHYEEAMSFLGDMSRLMDTDEAEVSMILLADPKNLTASD